MVVFDATTLTLLLKPDASAPADPRTGKPIERAGDRVDAYVGRLARDKERILIPTPVLAEVLVQSGAAGVAYVQRIQKLSVFELGDFDVLAALELAQMTDAAIAAGDKKLGETDPWQKIKVDRQTIAIAKVKGAKIIFTDDGPLGRFAARMGMLVVKLHTLPLPSSGDAPPPPDMFVHGLEEAVTDDEAYDEIQSVLSETDAVAIGDDEGAVRRALGSDGVRPGIADASESQAEKQENEGLELNQPRLIKKGGEGALAASPSSISDIMRAMDKISPTEPKLQALPPPTK